MNRHHLPLLFWAMGTLFWAAYFGHALKAHDWTMIGASAFAWFAHMAATIRQFLKLQRGGS